MKKNRNSTVSITVHIFAIVLKTLIMLGVISIQLAWIYFSVFYYRNFPILTAISSVLSILISCYIYTTYQNTSYRFLWIIVIMIFPFAGTVWYLLYGYGKSAPKKKQRMADAIYIPLIEKRKSDLSGDSSLIRKTAEIIEKTSKFPIYDNCCVNYFDDGKTMYDKMMSDMMASEKYIFIETFILAEGKLWNETEKLLIEKAKSGVKIFILFDSIGSFGRIKPKAIKKLKKIPNIEIHGFNPISFKLSPTLNHRDHRKLVIIDGKIAYVGGMNFADEYVHYVTKYGYWRDGGIRLTGEAIKNYIILFCENWFITTTYILKPSDYYADYVNEEENENNCRFIAFGDTPADDANPAYNSIMSLIDNATKSIRISTPYLIIDDEMVSALCRAADSGIDVRILVPGIPDKKIVYTVTRSHYDRLLEHNIAIYELSGGFNHAKSVMVDGEIALCGSINMDYRSLLLHFELGGIIIDNQVVQEMQSDFDSCIFKSILITNENYKKRSWLVRLWQYILHLIAPVL